MSLGKFGPLTVGQTGKQNTTTVPNMAKSNTLVISLTWSGAWTTTGSLTKARWFIGACGSFNSTLAFGGNVDTTTTSPEVSTTETWVGIISGMVLHGHPLVLFTLLDMV
jgi:hypothetical protein